MKKYMGFASCPETSALDRSRGGAHTKKNLRIPGSLSLSLSLSLLHWRREREERSGGVGPRSGPTTRLPILANVPLSGRPTGRHSFFGLLIYKYIYYFYLLLF